MTPDQYFELFKLLGVAAPLVWILWMQLREATAERKDITGKFLATMARLDQIIASGGTLTLLQAGAALVDLARMQRRMLRYVRNL